MKSIRLTLFPCLLAMILTGLLVTPTFAHRLSTSPATCGKGWSVVSSPNRGQSFYSNDFQSVAAISATDVWAVGVDVSPGGHGGKGHALLEHWNGNAWSIVDGASPRYANLNGVAAVATNDVWAVGRVEHTSGMSDTLTEHWNGTTWGVVPSPNPGVYSGPILNGVVAVSTNDVWAVGSFFPKNYPNTQPLIEHWNGSQWSVVPSHSGPLAGSKFLSGVTAISATDVWAVGSSYNPAYRPLIEHWDGTQWTVVTSPMIGAGSGLGGVTAVSATDVWAVGFSNSNNVVQTLIEHWDGTQWTIVASPNPSSSSNILNGVAAVSATAIWAVGRANNSQGNDITLIEHWNGTAWSAVSSPSPGSFDNGLEGVAQVPGTTQIWTVGHYTGNNQVDRTLTELHC